MFERSVFIIFTVLCTLTALAVAGCGDETGGSLLLLQEQVDKSYDSSKQKVIDAAVAMYVAENGQHPGSLQDLVNAGLLAPGDILDHDGKPLTLTPDMSITSISKSCGACGERVSNNSKVGDTCPHCGVRWGYETTSYSGPPE